MKNAINWFEIFVTDLDRALGFYEQALGRSLRREEFGGEPTAVFPADEHAVAGSLVQRATRKPSSEGVLVYLDTAGQMASVLARVPAAGGAVVLPRTSIGPMGWIATIRDTEGNVVGLHEEA